METLNAYENLGGYDLLNVKVDRLMFCTLTPFPILDNIWVFVLFCCFFGFCFFKVTYLTRMDSFKNPCNLQMQPVIIVTPLWICHMHVHLLLGTMYL